jgi:hypothetical protein
MMGETLVRCIALALVLGLVLTRNVKAGDVTHLPRDSGKEAWVRQILARLGLSNDIRVVRDDSLTGSTVCAFATIRDGVQWVAYDPHCVKQLDPPGQGGTADIRHFWWSLGVMFHEIAHHVAGHTATTLNKSSIERELEAERWVGWAFRYSRYSLAQALLYAEQGQQEASATHPGREARVHAVEQGWLAANKMMGDSVSSSAMPMTGGANQKTEALGTKARGVLGALRKK